MEDSEHLPRIGSDREDLEELYSWNYEEAFFVDQMWVFEYQWESPSDKVRPIERWREAQRLKALADRYEKGDKTALFEAMSICAYNSFPMPKWCANAIVKAYISVKMYELKTWDDIFGKMYKKNTQVETNRQKIQDYGKVSRRFHEILEATPGKTIDIRLFGEIGKEMATGGKSKIGDIYYKEKRQHDDFINDGPPVIDSSEE